jgi:hypothetical protein
MLLNSAFALSAFKKAATPADSPIVGLLHASPEGPCSCKGHGWLEIER